MHAPPLNFFRPDWHYCAPVSTPRSIALPDGVRRVDDPRTGLATLQARGTGLGTVILRTGIHRQQGGLPRRHRRPLRDGLVRGGRGSPRAVRVPAGHGVRPGPVGGRPVPHGAGTAGPGASGGPFARRADRRTGGGRLRLGDAGAPELRLRTDPPVPARQTAPADQRRGPLLDGADLAGEGGRRRGQRPPGAPGGHPGLPAPAIRADRRAGHGGHGANPAGRAAAGPQPVNRLSAGRVRDRRPGFLVLADPGSTSHSGGARAWPSSRTRHTPRRWRPPKRLPRCSRRRSSGPTPTDV